MIAPAHIGQGSSVTYRSQRWSRQPPSLRQALWIASISAWQSASLSNQIHTEYFSIELFPLDPSAVEQILHTVPDKYRSILKNINEAEWDAPVNINPYFSLTKINGNLLDCELPTDIDAVYFDAFAPDKQPEMWSVDIFQKLYEAMSPAATLTTYCAKGAIRRMLNMIGFTTQRLPGPPGGKREILRAIKPSQTTDNKE